MELKLNTIVLPEKTVTFDFPGCKGLSFDLTFLGKDELIKITKKATKHTYDKKTRQPKEETDPDAFMDLYAKAVVRGWSGFKAKYLPEFVLADISSLDPEEEIDYSEENAIYLLKNSTVLDNWVGGIVGELSNFSKQESKKKPVSSKTS